ncbi:hypothetical protein SDC9_211615 [bioreactor metagenome]|uniref:Uncharacterized protein n=1 Tax=bioreactor metagenome TaxID=1076179 RepID=A0A645JJJ5_9ZZZZ
MVSRHDPLQFLQPGFGNFAVGDHITGHDHLTGARVQKPPGIAGMDAAAHLKPAGIGPECAQRSLFVAGAEHDHVASGEAVGAIHPRKIGRIVLGLEVGAQPGAVGAEGAADNLLDFAVMQIDAGTEPHKKSFLQK